MFFICIFRWRVFECNPINRFRPATLMSLSQERTWNSNVICRGVFVLFCLRRVAVFVVALLIRWNCWPFTVYTFFPRFYPSDLWQSVQRYNMIFCRSMFRNRPFPHFRHFKAIFFKEKSIDTEASFKMKITKHGKKKNEKDEIVNILLKHLFTSL